MQYVDKEYESNREARVAELIALDYSIHFHAWTQAEMFEMVAAVRTELGIPHDIEMFCKNHEECIFVLTKQ